MLSSLAHSSLEVHCSFRLKFFLQKITRGVAFLLTADCLAVVLLDHEQHALLRGLSTQRVWHCACAYVLLPGAKSKVCPKKRMPLCTKKQACVAVYYFNRMPLCTEKQARTAVYYFNPQHASWNI